MKHKENILKAIVLLVLLGLGAILMFLPRASVSQMSSYCSTPPFISNSIPPNVLIVLDNSGSMNDQAYAGTYNPTQFTSGYYYGYFDPAKNYKYTANNRWEVTIEPITNGTAANPIASGNFLNWATMRRVDVSKKLLIGGKAAPRSPEGGVTVKLLGENSPFWWNFSKDFTTTSGLIYPFVGDYRFSMSGDQLTITPIGGVGSTATVYPNGDIIPGAWTPIGASSAWQAVLTSDGDTSYIQNTTTNINDQVILDYSYTGGPLAGTISGVSVKVVAKRTGIRTRKINGAIRVNGVDYLSNYVKLFTFYFYTTYSFSWATNPATGLNWQWSDFKPDALATLQGFGVKAYTLPTSSNHPHVTQIYLVISVSTPSGGPYSIIVDQGMTKAEGLIDHLSSDVRFGLAFYNYGSGIESGYTNGRYDGGKIENYVDFGSTTNMITSISNMSPDTWTPLAETLYEMVRYFRQDSPYYSNSPADYATGLNYDPYYYQYSKLAGSGLTDQYVPCAKSFVLMLTDGESTKDQNIPTTYRDYDNDGKDDGTYPDQGTDYLDDVALWARTADARPGTCTSVPTAWQQCLPGTQNIYLYSVFMFGKGSQLLKDAAINGGFNDLNGDGKPGPDLREYLRDSNGDGVITSADLPLTYYEGDDGYELEASITNAIADILKRAASGTAASVLTTSSRGAGSMVQAYFLPTKQEGVREVNWLGYMQNLWIDPQDNLREDTIHDYQLRLDQDYVMKLYFNNINNETEAALFTTDVDGSGGTLSSCSPSQKKNFTEITPLWEAGRKLALKSHDTRTIYLPTKVIRGSTTTYTFSQPNYFTTTNVTGNTTLSNALNPDATYTADKIVRYIRGEDLESTDANFRDRRITVDGSLRVWKLGDIISSTPKVFANTPLNTYQIDYSDITYYQYISSSNYKEKSSIAFAGANDGMLHAFRVGYLKDKGLVATIKAIFHGLFSTDTTPTNTDKLGEEIWAYIPFNAFPYLKYLASTDYCHVYYADLSVRLVDVSIGGTPTAARDKNSWRTILIGGMRFGGACAGSDANPTPPLSDVGFSSYFAIDITNPESPVPLWEFSDDDLGYTTTYPSIIRTGDRDKNGNWYVAIGSGSKVLPKGSVDIGRNTLGYIYIIDLGTGALVKKIAIDHNAIVGDILAIDRDKNYHAEEIYFGTSYNYAGVWKGKLMTIDIPNQDLSSSWTPTITTLFSAGYPFTASPDAVKDKDGNIWVYAGSGKFYSGLDKTDLSQQIFFGLKDKDLLVAESSLYDATSVATTGTVRETAQVCAYDSSTNNFGLKDVVTSINLTSTPPSVDEEGWKVYLSNGERVISRPLAAGGLVDFLSYKPSSDICSFGGDSYIYSLSYTTGVAPSNVAILSAGITSGITGSVTVYKGVLLGPGAPPAGEAIIIVPPKEAQEELKKKIQIATGVVVEIENEPIYSIARKIVHWLKK